MGGAITTTEAARDAGRNRYTSADGMETQDIENTTSYDGDAIQVGVSVGNTTGKPQAQMNGIGYGSDGDSDSSVTRAGITGIAGNKDITTDNRAEYAGKLENSFDANQVNKELNAQTQITQEFGKEAPKAVAEFSQNRINAIRANPNLSADEKMAAISNWDEGGIYRVAAHTALSALGTGSVEGALTTGGVAAAAPTINNLEAKMRDNLIAQGMDADTASNTTKGITSLALAGAGVAVGLDTSSTATAINLDANNRQLHPDEAVLIKQLAQDYAQKNGISITEAEKRLTRGALYNIDVGWQSSINNYIDDQEIQTYQQAYNYLTNQTRDISVSDLSNQISLANQPVPEVSDPTLPSTTLDKIVVTANKSKISDFEKQRAVYYVDTAVKGFTATKEDFKNEELFLVNAFSNVETRNLLEDRAAIKQSEVGFIEGIGRDVKGAKGTIVGASTGVYKGAKETLETVVDSAKKTGEIVEGLINSPKKTISSGVNKAQSLIVNAPDIAKEGLNQLEEASALRNAKLNLYDMQQDAEAKAKYKTNIAGQIAGGGGIGSIGKNVVKKGGNIIDNVADDIGKGLDGMSPKPATVVGNTDMGGATTITGKPNGSKNGIGAAETGGAILAISDANEGAYTNNSDSSITGPKGGRVSSTGQFDNNGNEIYQRDSGGYYVIDDKGVQWTTTSPNVRPATNDAKYNWLDEQRNPDPNVQSSFNAQSKPLSNNQYYKTEAEWQAPGKGTGLNYKVYQQEIDLNAKPRESLGDMRTNADRMKQGGSPYVLKNGQYEQIQLHHSRQDGRGALFETSESTHLNLTNQNGRQAVHPYSLQQHPDYPVDRPKFKTDKETYWKDRLNQLQGD